MPYGTLKVDNITFTNAGSDATTTVSGLVAGTGFANLSITGTISGATITGNTGDFTTITAVTGIFTTTLSGANINDSKGNVRAVPQNSQTTGYTLVASDTGKHVFTVSGVTIPSGVFSVGDAVSIYNSTTGDITITEGSNVTLYQAGASGTGNRTLAQRGLATVLCVSGANGTEFVIGGAGLS